MMLSFVLMDSLVNECFRLSEYLRSASAYAFGEWITRGEVVKRGKRRRPAGVPAGAALVPRPARSRQPGLQPGAAAGGGPGAGRAARRRSRRSRRSGRSWRGLLRLQALFFLG